MESAFKSEQLDVQSNLFEYAVWKCSLERPPHLEKPFSTGAESLLPLESMQREPVEQDYLYVQTTFDTEVGLSRQVSLYSMNHV